MEGWKTRVAGRRGKVPLPGGAEVRTQSDKASKSAQFDRHELCPSHIGCLLNYSLPRARVLVVGRLGTFSRAASSTQVHSYIKQWQICLSSVQETNVGRWRLTGGTCLKLPKVASWRRLH